MSEDGKNDTRTGEARGEVNGPSLWRRLLLMLRGRDSEETLRESIEELLEEHPGPESQAESAERTLLRNVLEVGDLRVGEIRVPRADMIAVPADIEFAALVKVLIEAEHSRLPVYREVLDDVIGMVHIKDVLPYLVGREGFALDRILRRVLVVPPSKIVLDLLREMRNTRVHMAVVVDEYGGVDGLVTIEDLVEQIVGEIDDEHDEQDGLHLVERGPGVYEAHGRCAVEDLERKFQLRLINPDDNDPVDTLGGLIVGQLGRVPMRGEVVEHPAGLVFEVTDADMRRVKRVRIRLAQAAGTPASD